MPTGNKFRHVYEEFTDEKLESFAKEYTQLTPEAQEALFVELHRRGLVDAEKTARSVEARAEADAQYEEDAASYFTPVSCRTDPEFSQVRVLRGTLYFPQICPNCGKASETTAKIAGGQQQGRRIEMLYFDVPHCTECKTKLNRGGAELAFLLLAGLAVATVALFLVLGDMRTTMGLLTIGMFLIFNSLRSLGRNIPRGMFVVEFDEQSVYLAMRHRSYAEKFCNLNKARQVRVSRFAEHVS